MLIANGSPLGPYEILSQLGAGGMGDVYPGQDARLAREVALKLNSTIEATVSIPISVVVNWTAGVKK
ncbi:MAG: hypothetical protein AABN34_22240 [Acidobacteriota bacterium]